MANTRELLRRRKGVQNTKKITRTMELISTAKLKKLSDRIGASRPYALELEGLIQELLASGLELDLAEKRDPIEKLLVLSFASNRGLCGAYNGKIVEGTMETKQKHVDEGRKVISEVVGKRCISMLNYRDFEIDKEYRDIDDRTGYDRIKEMARRYQRMFLSGEVDRVEVVYTAFHSKSKQDLQIEQLLPIVAKEEQEEGEAETRVSTAGEYLFEPSPEEVLSEIAPLAVEFHLYRMFLESVTSEQAYRMRAMKNATENAEDMINDLTRQYNRARQTQITMELLDILGGTEAL